MAARLDLYKTYYPDPNPNPVSNHDTNPKPYPNSKPNPTSQPYFGIVVRSKYVIDCFGRRFLSRVPSSGVSRIKLTMRLLLKQM